MKRNSCRKREGGRRSGDGLDEAVNWEGDSIDEGRK